MYLKLQHLFLVPTERLPVLLPSGAETICQPMGRPAVSVGTCG